MENFQDEKSPKKLCSSCRKLAPLVGFHKGTSNKDGLKYVCKPCCQAYSRERYRKRKYLAESKGLCVRYGCQFRPNEGSALCAMHFFKATATSMKKPTLWRKLEEIAESQNYTCTLTGDQLLAGVNMSLDHIKPVSKYPELVGNLGNMQWVTKWANASKSNLTVGDFISNCLKVVECAPPQLKSELRK